MQDADRHHAGHGSQARSTKSPSVAAVLERARPPSATRSASPTMPVPAPGIAATQRRPTGQPVADLDRQAVARRRPRPPRRRRAPARACARSSGPPGRSRYAVRPTPSGTPLGRPRVARARACPPARDSSTSAARSAQRRLRRARARRPASASSRSTPMTSRRSCSAWCALPRITPAARRPPPAGASGRNSSAPACRLSSEMRWASTSCISRAIRSRSSRRACVDPQLLLGLGALRPVAQGADELAPGADEHAPGDEAGGDEDADDGADPEGVVRGPQERVDGHRRQVQRGDPRRRRRVGRCTATVKSAMPDATPAIEENSGQPARWPARARPASAAAPTARSRRRSPRRSRAP